MTVLYVVQYSYILRHMARKKRGLDTPKFFLEIRFHILLHNNILILYPTPLKKKKYFASYGLATTYFYSYKKFVKITKKITISGQLLIIWAYGLYL
jgi:hypothetical protein